VGSKVPTPWLVTCMSITAVILSPFKTSNSLSLFIGPNLFNCNNSFLMTYGQTKNLVRCYLCGLCRRFLFLISSLKRLPNPVAVQVVWLPNTESSSRWRNPTVFHLWSLLVNTMRSFVTKRVMKDPEASTAAIMIKYKIRICWYVAHWIVLFLPNTLYAQILVKHIRVL